MRSSQSVALMSHCDQSMKMRDRDHLTQHTHILLTSVGNNEQEDRLYGVTYLTEARRTMHSPGGSDHSEERAARMRQEIPDPTVKLLEGSVTHCKCL
jgi:hypothetical protein